MESPENKHLMGKMVLYPQPVATLFRISSSAGACALWFDGSWQDMIVAGTLAVVVFMLGASHFLSRHERVILKCILVILSDW
jgi:uncharacterized membrane protein YjjP (DUF1212 family)